MQFSNEVIIDGVVIVDGSASTQPVSGTISVGNFPGTQAVTGPLTDTQLRATAVPISGTVAVSNLSDANVGVATVTNISVGVSSTTLSASNAAKTKVAIYNETGTLYVKLGSTASSTSYSYRLTANAVLELSGYYGLVTAIKASGTTSVLVTEYGI